MKLFILPRNACLQGLCPASSAQWTVVSFITSFADSGWHTILSSDVTKNFMLLMQGSAKQVERRPTISEGLYSGLSRGAGLGVTQLDAKMQLLVEAPAAVEDALASLLDEADQQLQV